MCQVDILPFKFKTFSRFKSNMGGVAWPPSLFAYPGQSTNSLTSRHTNMQTTPTAVIYKNGLWDICLLIYQMWKLSRAGLNNVKTENTETAHTLLSVSWKVSLYKTNFYMYNTDVQRTHILNMGGKKRVRWRRPRIVAGQRIGGVFVFSDWHHVD